MSTDPSVNGYLFPVFVTSSSVDHQMIDEFLESTKDWNPDTAEENGGPYVFTLQRTFSDAPSELRRVSEVETLRGAEPPTSPNEELDFLGWSVDALAQYVVRYFCDYRGSLGKWVQGDHPAHGCQNQIDHTYFVVLDNRFARDRAVLVVEIPKQAELDQNDLSRQKVTRNWIKRDAYNDYSCWECDKDDELITARVPMAEARSIELLALAQGVDCIAGQAQSWEEKGVSQEWELHEIGCADLATMRLPLRNGAVRASNLQTSDSPAYDQHSCQRR